MLLSSAGVALVPDCKVHTGEVRCFLKHSGNPCRRHKRASAPSAERCHSDMPEHTHTHTIKTARIFDMTLVRVITLMMMMMMMITMMMMMMMITKMCVCVCVCHLMNFLPSIFISHPCNHKKAIISLEFFLFLKKKHNKKMNSVIFADMYIDIFEVSNQ